MIQLRIALSSILVGCFATEAPVVVSEFQGDDYPPTHEPNVSAEYAAAGVPVVVRRIIRLDPGKFVDGEWEGVASSGAVATLANETAGDGESLSLHIGWNAVTVQQQGCTPVVVPVRAEPAVDFVAVSFLGCNWPLDAPALPDGTLLDRSEFSIGRMAELRSLELFTDVPSTDDATDLPQRWITQREATDVCGFFGGRLMRRDEWLLATGASPKAERVGQNAGRTPVGAEPSFPQPEGPTGVESTQRVSSLGPYAHEDLHGNIAEWTGETPQTAETRQTADYPAIGSASTATSARAVAVGGSWLRPGGEWQVPAEARSDEIGFRCAYPPPNASVH